MAGSYVLVVDDDPHITALLLLILERGGWQARATRNGSEALKMARAEPPDAVLVDLWMPGMSGAELVRELGAEPELAQVPVIMTTGDTTAPEVPGIFATVNKPFRIPALYRTIRAALRHRQGKG